MKIKLLITILIIGLLTACGSQSTDAPASQPTEEPATPTQSITATPALTNIAIHPNTMVPTDTAQPTEIPATQEANPGVTVSFANDIQPILKNRCWICHGGKQTEEGLVLSDYDDIMNGSNNGLVVIAGNADNSLLIEQIVSREMPKRGPKLTPPQVQLIIDWINQGALNN